MSQSSPSVQTSLRITRAFGHARYALAANPVTLFAVLLFMFVLGCAIFGPMLAPYDPLQTNGAMALKAPSWQHWFGTDQ